MAGSEQKTQIATELPPEVAAAAGRAPSQPAAPALAAGARTMMAEAPALPAGPGAAPPNLSGGPPPMAPPPMAAAGAPPAAAGARTLFAPAPNLPGPGSGSGTGSQATVFTGGPGNANVQATLPPGARSPVMANPLPMMPAMALLGGAGPSAGLPPQARWVIGPVLMLVVAIVTTAIANRVWPPATNSGNVGPSILAASRKIQIVSDPAGAEVAVDGVVQDNKTPVWIKGDIGSSAQVRISLDGYEPREFKIAFPKDARPPLKVRLEKVGAKPGRVADNDRFDDRPGTKTKPEDDDDGDGDKPDDKSPKPDDKSPKPDDKSPKPDDKAPKPDDKSPKPDDKSPKPAAKDSDEDDEKKGKKNKKDKDKDKDKKGKGLLTVTVRPWAIVFIDGKKIQQTPLRDYKISAGSHTILLVNDTKGKRETIKIKVSAGESVAPIVRTWQ